MAAIAPESSKSHSHNLIRPDPTRSRDIHDVPLRLPHQRPGNRRSNGNPSRPDIRLILPYDLIDDAILRVVLIIELHDGPEHDPAAVRQLARIDDLGRSQLRL